MSSLHIPDSYVFLEYWKSGLNQQAVGMLGFNPGRSFGSKDERSSCNLVSRWMEGCRMGLYLHGCEKSTLH